MASSNDLATIDPWMFRSTIGDSWYSDAFARETETESALTRALQQSLFNNHQQSEIISAANHTISTPFMMKQSDYCCTTTTPSASTVTASGSGSEPETPGSKRRGGASNIEIGRPTKRKSRASKRSMTTFIQTDAANFRQMVQQVTGGKLQGNGQLPVATLLKPEPLRQPFINKLQGLLPTLDTSAYLLDHQNNNKYMTGGTTGFSQPPSMNLVAEDGGAGMDFYSFCSFPTLESSI